MPNIGSYNQRITIQSYSETRAANGGVIRDYSTLATRWAKVTPVAGGETTESTVKVARILLDIELYAGGLTLNETMRIVWRSKTFNITSIDEAGYVLNETLKIRAVAKDNE